MRNTLKSTVAVGLISLQVNSLTCCIKAGMAESVTSRIPEWL
jgi:hypothetical protein